jgi:hypothetical protein
MNLDIRDKKMKRKKSKMLLNEKYKTSDRKLLNIKNKELTNLYFYSEILHYGEAIIVQVFQQNSVSS